MAEARAALGAELTSRRLERTTHEAVEEREPAWWEEGDFGEDDSGW